MKRLFYLLICAFLFYTCTNQTKKDGDLEYINIDSPEKADFSELFSEFQLIFPETTDSSLFGVAIWRIESHKDRLYLLNQKQSGANILCFNINGHFLFALDKLGNGYGEYTILADFFIDTKENNIVVISEGHKWLYYDMDGNYLFTKNCAKEAFPERFTREFNDSLYVCYRAYDQPECAEILFIDRDSLQVKQFAKSTYPILSFLVPSLSISNSRGVFYYCDGNDIVYDITSGNGEKKTAYVLDFGEKQRSFKKNFPQTETENALSLLRDGNLNKEVCNIFSFLDNGKFFAINYFEYVYDNSSARGFDYILHTTFYNRDTKKSYKTTNINCDIFNSVNMGGSSDGYFYAVLNELFSRDEVKKIVESKYLDEETKKALLNMDVESNPIILKFK